MSSFTLSSNSIKVSKSFVMYSLSIVFFDAIRRWHIIDIHCADTNFIDTSDLGLLIVRLTVSNIFFSISISFLTRHNNFDKHHTALPTKIDVSLPRLDISDKRKLNNSSTSSFFISSFSFNRSKSSEIVPNISKLDSCLVWRYTVSLLSFSK